MEFICPKCKQIHSVMFQKTNKNCQDCEMKLIPFKNNNSNNDGIIFKQENQPEIKAKCLDAWRYFKELKEGITMYQSKEFRITNSFNGTIIIHPALSKCDYTLKYSKFKEVWKEYKGTRSNHPGDYCDITILASYILTAMNMYFEKIGAQSTEIRLSKSKDSGILPNWDDLK